MLFLLYLVCNGQTISNGQTEKYIFGKCWALSLTSDPKNRLIFFPPLHMVVHEWIMFIPVHLIKGCLILETLTQMSKCVLKAWKSFKVNTAQALRTQCLSTGGKQLYQFFFEIWAKVKNFLRLSHFYIANLYCLLFSEFIQGE